MHVCMYECAFRSLGHGTVKSGEGGRHLHAPEPICMRAVESNGPAPFQPPLHDLQCYQPENAYNKESCLSVPAP